MNETTLTLNEIYHLYDSRIILEANPYFVFSHFGDFLKTKGFDFKETQLLRLLLEDIINKNIGYRDEIFKSLFQLLTDDTSTPTQ